MRAFSWAIRGLVVVAGAVLAPAACGLGVTGVAPDGMTPDATSDAGPSGVDGSTVEPADASQPADAPVDAPVAESDAGCPPLVPVPKDSKSRGAIIARASAANAPDAGLAAHVFRECVSFVLDTSTAALVHGSPKATAKVLLEWEPSALWIRFDVEDANLVGTDDTPYDNDSVELYVSSNPDRTSSYGSLDHQIIVDHRGVTLHDTAGPPSSYSDAFATKTATGYRAVIRVKSQLLGGGFTSGKRLYLDALLSDGTQQASFLVWAQEPHPPPPEQYPSSDPRLFSPVTLE